ncbi:MAG: VanZ family protein [Anaerolineales bacterium]|nr:VanZ family protein [Anaerolineales bacterium]
MVERKLDVLRWIPAVLMMGAIFFFSSRTAGQIPYFGSLDFLLKKGGHAIGYGMLGLSYYYALPRTLSVRYRWIMAWMMAILFALSDEFHQSFVAGRTSTVRDVLIDSGGAGIALIFGAGYSSNSRSNTSS